MKITFLGAAGTVTGSKYLIESERTRLLVDCGLYQGVKQLRLRNWQPLPAEPSSLDAVVLSHAHIDHSGYLPAFVRDGFEGPVHCTRPTAELCRILLPDSGRLHEEDAAYANRKGFSKHRPALPLYTEEDGERACRSLAPVELDHSFQVGDLEVRLSRAGHILGAASVHVSDGRRSIVLSGDLGRPGDLLMPPPAAPGQADWIVVESTYGDRLHGEADPIQAIAEVVRRTVGRGGVLLIPSFAVGRAQTMLYCLHEVFQRELAPRVPVFVNSPMATNVTELYRRFVADHRLSPELCEAVCDVATFVRTQEESKELTSRSFPSVIVSASGMATGGRVLHHLKTLAPDHRNTILLPGFQAPGTRGDALVSGADAVKIHGRLVPVRAEIVKLDVFSAHADQQEILSWLEGTKGDPRRVFVCHGETVPADTLRRLVQERFGWHACVPEYRESVDLS